MIRLLVVDDSALMRKVLGGIFSAEGDFELAFARDGIEALDLVARFAPDVVTLDVTMPGLDGLACLDRIMLERPCPVVMLSSLTAEGAETILDALARGAVDVLPKPAGAVSLARQQITASRCGPDGVCTPPAVRIVTLVGLLIGLVLLYLGYRYV
mgnify:CR=1 FL=1